MLAVENVHKNKNNIIEDGGEGNMTIIHGNIDIDINTIINVYEKNQDM
jgi:hypothetical protein